MTCRDEVLACIQRLVRKTGRDEFTVLDVLKQMQTDGTSYEESTIRTHIVSRMCANAPDHHSTTFDDLERVDHGLYRLTT